MPFKNSDAVVLTMATAIKDELSELCKSPGSSANIIYAATLVGRAHALTELALKLKVKNEAVRQELVTITALLQVMPWNPNIFLNEEQPELHGLQVVDFAAARSSFFGGLQLAASALNSVRKIGSKVA